ncbi:MAG: hypothetical protein WA476_18740, partial [Acidobacteriaceae bacterium]
TCLGKKAEAFGIFDPKGEMPSPLQKIGLLSATLGRNSILTWSRLMVKTPIADRPAVGLSFTQPALGQSNCSPTSRR